MSVTKKPDTTGYKTNSSPHSKTTKVLIPPLDVRSEQFKPPIVRAQGAQTPSSGRQNINIIAAQLHVLGDIIQSVGVLVAAVLIKISPRFNLADPICTFLFSVLVIITTIPTFIRCI